MAGDRNQQPEGSMERQGRIIYVPVTTPEREALPVIDTRGLQEVCPLCLQPDLLEQDHDHRTDLCRGRICSSCNHLVGRFDRPVDEIQRFLDYLQYWAAQHAEGVGQSYTEYMRVVVPGYRRGRRAPRPRKVA